MCFCSAVQKKKIACKPIALRLEGRKLICKTSGYKEKFVNSRQPEWNIFQITNSIHLAVKTTRSLFTNISVEDGFHHEDQKT